MKLHKKNSKKAERRLEALALRRSAPDGPAAARAGLGVVVDGEYWLRRVP